VIYSLNTDMLKSLSVRLLNSIPALKGVIKVKK